MIGALSPTKRLRMTPTSVLDANSNNHPFFGDVLSEPLPLDRLPTKLMVINRVRHLKAIHPRKRLTSSMKRQLYEEVRLYA